MKKNIYKIPKGYKGITNDIELTFNSQLAVITGLNGSGKSTMLKYLYENYPDRSRCFIKTPQGSNLYEQERRMASAFRRNNRFPDDFSFDKVMEDIESIGLGRRGRFESPFLDKTDFYSSLFDKNSLSYDNGYKYLETIVNRLSDYQLEDIDILRYELGVVRQVDIENCLIAELNRTKEDNIKTYGVKFGRSILQKFNKNEFTEDQVFKINSKKEKIEEKLKIELRNSSKIKSEQSLKQFIYGLITKEFRSIESIVHKMSTKIFQDFKTKSRTRTKKLWEEINEELEKYNENGYFKYKLVPPQLYESSYEIAFEALGKTSSYIHFDSLSSGEKIIFELICYYFAAKESKLEMIMLDEFDANLNPLLAERYIAVIKEQFKKIKVILTTHSPSTVVEVSPHELYELKDSSHLDCAKDEEGKKDILRRLAPKFVYHGEFGILEDVFNNKYEIIVFLEGKNDVKNFEKGLNGEKYKFIDSTGVGNMPDIVKIFKVIPFFKELAKQKKVVFLFDFDKDGIEHLDKSITINAQEVYKEFSLKKPFSTRISDDLNIYISHLVPDDSHSWDLKDEYRHQELKKDGQEGIKRQFEHLKNITTEKVEEVELV